MFNVGRFKKELGHAIDGIWVILGILGVNSKTSKNDNAEEDRKRIKITMNKGEKEEIIGTLIDSSSKSIKIKLDDGSIRTINTDRIFYVDEIKNEVVIKDE